MTPENRVTELKISLPHLEKPIGNYLHSTQIGDLLFLSGKGPLNSFGKVGKDISVEQAKNDAFTVGCYLLSAIREHTGSLNNVEKILKVTGYINSDPEFKNHSEVIDGCSDLFVQVFRENGKHARAAIGVASLPGGMTIEIEAILKVIEQ